MATIHIQSGKNNVLTTVLEANIQSVPFKIHADCDAKVAKYFTPYVKTNDDKSLTGSFRGYPLKGRKMLLPEGYVGIVVNETIKPTTDKEERRFYVTSNFKSLTSWNWDRAPSKNDTIVQALDWIDIAEALHSPIVEE